MDISISSFNSSDDLSPEDILRSSQKSLITQIKRAEDSAAAYYESALKNVNQIKQEMGDNIHSYERYNDKKIILIAQALIFLMNGHCGAFVFCAAGPKKPEWKQFISLYHRRNFKQELLLFSEAVKGGYLTSKNIDPVRSYFQDCVFTAEMVQNFSEFELLLMGYVRSCVDCYDQIELAKELRKRLEKSMKDSSISKSDSVSI